jgi:acyl-coenzyme A synthetase/AMP-(fatty) acid ligase
MHSIWKTFEKAAVENENKPAFVQGSKSYSFSEWHNKSLKVKQYWEGKPWQTILLFQPFNFSFLVQLLGLLGAKQGTIIPALYVGFPKLKLLYRTIGINYIVTTPLFGLLRKFLLPNIMGKGIQQKIKERLNSPTMLVCTSGTTGIPKVGFRNDAHLLAMFEALSRSINWEGCNGHLTWFPMVTLLNAGKGVTTYYPSKSFGKYNFNEIHKQVVVNQITHISGPPSALLDFITIGNLPDIKQVFVGGAIITESVAHSLKAGFPNADIYTIYGSTEVEPVSVSPLSKYLELLKSKNPGVPIGLIDQELEVKTNSLGTTLLNNNEKVDVGELMVKGPQVSKAIAIDSIGTEQDYDWVHMGDIGYFNSDNNLWLLGRKGFTFTTDNGISGPFAIECPIPPNSKWNGNITVIPINGVVTLVIAKSIESDLKAILAWCKTLGIVPEKLAIIKKMPKDKRHNSRIDYNAILKLVRK